MLVDNFVSKEVESTISFIYLLNSPNQSYLFTNY